MQTRMLIWAFLLLAVLIVSACCGKEIAKDTHVVRVSAYCHQLDGSIVFEFSEPLVMQEGTDMRVFFQKENVAMEFKDAVVEAAGSIPDEVIVVECRESGED